MQNNPTRVLLKRNNSSNYYEELKQEDLDLNLTELRNKFHLPENNFFQIKDGILLHERGSLRGSLNYEINKYQKSQPQQQSTIRTDVHQEIRIIMLDQEDLIEKFNTYFLNQQMIEILENDNKKLKAENCELQKSNSGLYNCQWLQSQSQILNSQTQDKTYENQYKDKQQVSTNNPSEILINQSSRSITNSLITLNINCYKCLQPIIENYIQTQCNHQYHDSCLQELFEGQVRDNYCKLQCLCKFYLKPQIIQELNQYQASDYMNNILLSNQIKHFVKNLKKYQLLKCEFCEFIIKAESQDVKISCSFCPNCLKNQTFGQFL